MLDILFQTLIFRSSKQVGLLVHSISLSQIVHLHLPFLAVRKWREIHSIPRGGFSKTGSGCQPEFLPPLLDMAGNLSFHLEQGQCQETEYQIWGGGEEIFLKEIFDNANLFDIFF
jgi:hypothetical protein